jgi:hypothetical protein
MDMLYNHVEGEEHFRKLCPAPLTNNKIIWNYQELEKFQITWVGTQYLELIFRKQILLEIKSCDVKEKESRHISRLSGEKTMSLDHYSVMYLSK